MAKQLGHVAKQVVARAISISRAATLAGEMEKGRSANAPAKVTGQRHAEGDDGGTANTGEVSRAPSTMDRCGPAHSKGARPTLGAGQHVFTVIEGGRREARNEETSPPASVSRSKGREHPARKPVLIV